MKYDCNVRFTVMSFTLAGLITPKFKCNKSILNSELETSKNKQSFSFIFHYLLFIF